MFVLLAMAVYLMLGLLATNTYAASEIATSYPADNPTNWVITKLPAETPKPTTYPADNPTNWVITKLPEVTPTPTVHPADNSANVIQENTNNKQKVDSGVQVNKQPDTGVGMLEIGGIFGTVPIGVMMSRFGKSRTSKKKGDRSEYAANEFNKRNSSLS